MNGQKAADCSNWPRTTDWARRWLLVHLPAGPAQLAIRIVGPPGGVARLPRCGVLLGRASVLELIRTATDADHFYSVLPRTLLCVGELLGEVILLAFRNDPRGGAYLWFAAFLFLDWTTSLESVMAVYAVRVIHGGFPALAWRVEVEGKRIVRQPPLRA